ncbi:hypothetical protein NPIL_484641 [Nephila pilipes]|uniref:Uncharacterized protein n=1 Tax=Nephila pilipes TaxID=299642 RepID=A0A8X6PS07_NEPPI|nr:hypothetical protein NPIL_484641 [Nephila pilipes]
MDRIVRMVKSLIQGKRQQTLYIEHHIDTGNHPSEAVSLYRLSSARKKVLKKELDDLLQKSIIEERESPYTAHRVSIQA